MNDQSGTNSVAIIVAIIAFIATMTNIWVNIVQNRKTRFINTVTSERIRWMERLRNYISDFCGQCWQFSVAHKDMIARPVPRQMLPREKIIAMQTELGKTVTLINLMLNPNDDNDKALMAKIEQVQAMADSSDFENFKIELNQVVNDTQALLKSKWELVKKEARKGNLKKTKAKYIKKV